MEVSTMSVKINPIKCQSDFIGYCLRVVEDKPENISQQTVGGLHKYNQIFHKCKMRNRSHIPIVKFLDKYRDFVEKSFIGDDDINDSWLTDTKNPILLEMDIGKIEFGFINITDLYLHCVDLANDMCQIFILYFYNMLIEIEPENSNLIHNYKTIDEFLKSYNSSESIKSQIDPISNMLKGIDFNALKSQAETMLESNPEVKQKLTEIKSSVETGDFNSLIAQAMPMMQNFFPMIAQGFAGMQTRPTEDPPISIEDQD